MTTEQTPSSRFQISCRAVRALPQEAQQTDMTRVYRIAIIAPSSL
jgi:hypothetical protein